MIKFITLYDNKQDVFVKTKEGIKNYPKYPWYFVITLDDAKKNRGDLAQFLRNQIVDRYEVENHYVRVYCSYLLREDAIRYFRNLKIRTFEDDLRPYQRWMIDEECELEIDQSVLYFDIETSDLGKGVEPGRDLILSIAAIGSDGKKYYLTHTDENEPSKGEELMLKKFVRLIDKYDILAGWHSEGFDLVAITKRCKIYDIEIGCWVAEVGAKDLGGLDNVRRLGKVKARPITFNHIDMMQKMKEMHYRDTELIKKVRSFGLGAVSRVILGKDKVDLKGRKIYDLWKNDPELLKEYNLQDVQLLVDLDAKLNIIKQKLVEHHVCCARLNDYTSHGKIDVFALKSARKRGQRLFSKPGKHEEEVEEIDEEDDNDDRRDDDRGKKKGDYEGGFVFDPVTGLHENVSVFDFNSLYPSIIKTFNISVDSYLGTWENGPEHNIKLPTGARFKKDELGIIPAIIQDVLDQRDNIRKNIMKTLDKNSPEYQNWHYRQYAFKVLANSMYGIMGANFSRYYSREVAEGITLTGQYLIKMMWKWMEDQGHVPIYGDSDSLFVKLKQGSDEEEVSRLADEFLANDVKKFNINKCSLHFSFEKTYKRFLSVAKKKYMGVAEDGEIKMMGLEAKKRDTLPQASDWQKELLDHLLLEQHDEQFYLNWVKEKHEIVSSGKLKTEEITFQKKLSKEIEDYGNLNKRGRPNPIPAHVKVAAWIKEQGLQGEEKINMYSQGAYISYVVIGSKKGIVPVHSSIYDGNYDKEYYWNACYGPSQRVLEKVFPSTEWDITKPKKTEQLTLL